MDWAGAIFLYGGFMLSGRVAFVAEEIIAGVLMVQLIHYFVPNRFGNDGGSGD